MTTQSPQEFARQESAHQEIAPPGFAGQVADTLLGAVSDAILATDAEGVIRFWNPGATRIFGFAAHEALGRSLDIIIPANLRARHWEGWRHALAQGQSRYGAGDLLSVPALTADGRRISVEFTIVFMRAPSGAITGVVSVLRDVSARFAELRDLRQRLAAQTAEPSPAP